MNPPLGLGGAGLSNGVLGGEGGSITYYYTIYKRVTSMVLVKKKVT